MTEYMLDTSAVGEIEEGEIDTRRLYTSSDEFYITHIQEDELNAAGTYSKFLLKVLEIVKPEKVPTDGAYYGVSKYGRAKYGKGEHVNTIENQLPPDDGNEIKDALIGGTAVHQGYILVTHDGDLREVINNETPGTAISISDFNSNI